MVGDNQLDIVVVNKRVKKVVVLDVTIQSDNNIRKKEHEKLEKYQEAERGAGKDVGRKGISGTSGDRSSWGYNLKGGRVAPTNPRNNT